MSLARAQEVDGRKLWLDPEVEAFVHVLEHGHPVLGWEGDPLLGLFRISGNRWEIARMERGRYRAVCRSKPGAKLDLSIIIHLMEHDLQRQTALQLLASVDAYNEKLRKDAEDKTHETLLQAVDKVYWGVRRDELGKHAL